MFTPKGKNNNNKNNTFNAQGSTGEKGEQGKSEYPFYDEKHTERVSNVINALQCNVMYSIQGGSKKRHFLLCLKHPALTFLGDMLTNYLRLREMFLEVADEHTLYR